MLPAGFKQVLMVNIPLKNQRAVATGVLWRGSRNRTIHKVGQKNQSKANTASVCSDLSVFSHNQCRTSVATEKSVRNVGEGMQI